LGNQLGDAGRERKSWIRRPKYPQPSTREGTPYLGGAGPSDWSKQGTFLGGGLPDAKKKIYLSVIIQAVRGEQEGKGKLVFQILGTHEKGRIRGETET